MFREGSGTPLQYSCLENPMDGGAWWAAVHGVSKIRTWMSDFTFTFNFHALEKKMATHSSVLAWRIPGMGEPGGLLSMGSHRVRHDWSDLAAAADLMFLFWKAKWLLLFYASINKRIGNNFCKSFQFQNSISQKELLAYLMRRKKITPNSLVNRKHVTETLRQMYLWNLWIMACELFCSHDETESTVPQHKFLKFTNISMYGSMLLVNIQRIAFFCFLEVNHVNEIWL